MSPVPTYTSRAAAYEAGLAAGRKDAADTAAAAKCRADAAYLGLKNKAVELDTIRTLGLVHSLRRRKAARAAAPLAVAQPQAVNRGVAVLPPPRPKYYSGPQHGLAWPGQPVVVARPAWGYVPVSAGPPSAADFWVGAPL